MGFQKQCPSCQKYTYVNTVDGNAPDTVRCQTCGFVIKLPKQKYKLKSTDFAPF